jgi:hypothetical protein
MKVVGEVSAAERQVASGFGLHRPDLVDVDIVDDHCVPIGLLECAREHDLRHVAPDARELDHGFGTRGILIGGRPVVGHELVGDPAVEERTRGGEPLVEVPVQLVVDHVPVELAVRTFEVAVDRQDIIKMIFLTARNVPAAPPTRQIATSSAATTRVRAVRDDAFKRCCIARSISTARNAITTAATEAGPSCRQGSRWDGSGGASRETTQHAGNAAGRHHRSGSRAARPRSGDAPARTRLAPTSMKVGATTTTSPGRFTSSLAGLRTARG